MLTFRKFTVISANSNSTKRATLWDGEKINRTTFDSEKFSKQLIPIAIGKNCVKIFANLLEKVVRLISVKLLCLKVPHTRKNNKSPPPTPCQVERY
ncbi:MAG: hypothetical protein R2795_21280, partial [Saprospiraceae bacterium]